MPVPAIVAAIGRSLAGLAASAGEWAAAAGVRAAATGASQMVSGSAAGASGAQAAASQAAMRSAAASSAQVAQSSGSAASSSPPGSSSSGTPTGPTWHQRFQNILNNAVKPIWNGFSASSGGSGGGGGGNIRPGLPGFGGPNSPGGLGRAITGNVTIGTLARAVTLDPVAITKTLVEMAKLPDRLMKFGDSLIHAQEGISVLSSSMSESVMRLNADRYRRDLRTAAMTGSTFSRLTASQSRLEGRLQPYQAMAQNLTNFGATQLLRLIELGAKAVEYLSPIDEIRDKINEWIGSSSATDPGMLTRAITDIASRPTPRYPDPPGARRMPPLPPVVNPSRRRP